MADRDRSDDEPPDDRPWRADPAAARARLAAPGLILVVFGLIGGLFQAGCLVAAATAPTVMVDFYAGLIAAQPPGPQKQQLEQQFAEGRDGMRLDTPFNVGGLVVGLVLDALMALGGLKMRAGSGYGLAMTGAIAGLIPLSGCCCFAAPVGLWAVIVLANPDVRAVFAANRGRPAADDPGADSDGGGRWN